jgi:hypothetical protein
MLVLGAFLCHATSPQLSNILPTGAQRGTEVELRFSGDRLQDAEEIICYEPGIEVSKPSSASNKVVKAQAKIGADCALGEHHLRLRTASGISELRTFFVGPFPVVDEKEPNNEPAKAQKLSLNTTVTVLRSSRVAAGASSLAPHSEQNFASSAFSCPQFGQSITVEV